MPLRENLPLTASHVANIGEKKLIEIGPNKVLSGLIRRISKNFDIVSIDKVSDLDLYEQK